MYFCGIIPTTTESMTRLCDLYNAKKTLIKEGITVSTELENQLRKAEEEIIRKEILPVLTETIEPVLAQIERELVLVVDYVPGAPLKLSLSRKRNITDAIPDAIEITSIKRPHVIMATDIKRGPKVDFSVTFDDGVRYAGRGKDVLIKSLQHMSLPHVATFFGRTFAGFPLVGRKRRVTEDNYKWQEEVDGWWVYVNMNNDTKMEVLRSVAKHLGVHITIRRKDD